MGRAIISAIIYIELFGTCCVMFILEGDNMFNLLGTSFLNNASAYMLAAAALMIPTVWLPDLKALSFLGIFGVSATCMVTASVREKGRTWAASSPFSLPRPWPAWPSPSSWAWL